jgi:hypothetical protein
MQSKSQREAHNAWIATHYSAELIRVKFLLKDDIVN